MEDREDFDFSNPPDFSIERKLWKLFSNRYQTMMLILFLPKTFLIHLFNLANHSILMFSLLDFKI